MSHSTFCNCSICTGRAGDMGYDAAVRDNRSSYSAGYAAARAEAAEFRNVAWQIVACYWPSERIWPNDIEALAAALKKWEGKSGSP